MDSQPSQPGLPCQPCQPVDNTGGDVTLSQLIEGTFTTKTAVTASAASVSAVGQKRSHKRQLSLDYVINRCGFNDSTDSIESKKPRRGRPCGSNKTKQVDDPVVSDIATKDKGKKKCAKKDKAEKDKDSDQLDLNIPVKAKSINIATQTYSIDSFIVNAMLQADPVDQNPSLSVPTEPLGQSYQTLLNLVQKCAAAMLLPVSDHVHSLQAEFQQLQAAFSELSAKVNELILFNTAVTLPVNVTTHTAHSTGSTFAAAVNQTSTRSGPSSDMAASASVENQCASYAQVIGRDRGQQQRVETQSSASATGRSSTVAAVYIDQHDQNRRARNVVITGLKPSRGTSDKDLVASLLRFEFHMRPVVKSVRRLGRDDSSNKIRPVLITLERQEDAAYLIDNARKLRDSEDEDIRKFVFLNADLTRAQAEAAYEIRCRRRAWRQRGDVGRTFVNSQNTNNDNIASRGTVEAVNMSLTSSITSSPISTPAVQSRLRWQQFPVATHNINTSAAVAISQAPSIGPSCSTSSTAVQPVSVSSSVSQAAVGQSVSRPVTSQSSSSDSTGAVATPSVPSSSAVGASSQTSSQ